MEQNQLHHIAQQFKIKGNVVEVKPLGNGLINTTYKVVTDGDNPDYVLQHINNAIFPDVDMLMNNIVAVTNHIRSKKETAGVPDIGRRVLEFVPCTDGKYYYLHEDKYWRVMVFIPDTVSKSGVSPESSYIVGETFGDFQAMLADIPDTLGESIKDFHNIEFRLQQFHEAVAADKCGRAKDVQDIIEEIEKRADDMCRSEKLYREGKLPKRICHCDTKVNNMMFDEDGRVLCVIDLDTVMPSFVFSDYGDFLRTGANAVAEDDPAIERVAFRRDIFEAFTRGYLESATFLTPAERDNLPYAVALFPYMQCVRFLTDYINGDTYYKIKYPEHNLVRTRNQLQLFREVYAQQQYMRDFINQCK